MLSRTHVIRIKGFYYLCFTWYKCIDSSTAGLFDLVAIFSVFISFSAVITFIEMIYEIRDTIKGNP